MANVTKAGLYGIHGLLERISVLQGRISALKGGVCEWCHESSSCSIDGPMEVMQSCSSLLKLLECLHSLYAHQLLPCPDLESFSRGVNLTLDRLAQVQ